MPLSVWCPYCGRKANTHSSSIGTLKRCSQCRRQYEVVAPAARPKRKPSALACLVSCLGLIMVGITGMVCCGGIGTLINHAPDKSIIAEKSPAAAQSQTSSTGPTPLSPGASPDLDPLPAVQSAPQPPAPPTPRDEADAVEGILTARDMLNSQRKDKGLAGLMTVVKNYPGTRAAKEAQGWLDEIDRQQRSRLVDANHCLEVAASKLYLKDIVQIPATVIDKGILRNVPYKSFRAGDYEVNVYGDPDQPAGLEIGIRGSLLKGLTAKRNCIDFIDSVLSDTADRKLLIALKLMTKDTIVRDGLTVEVTLPAEEDSYGGWWISVYREKALDQARASDAELNQIAVQRNQIQTNPSNAGDWNTNDLKLARPLPNGASIPSGGSVYVRGYTRKDGTYVHAYTRRR